MTKLNPYAKALMAFLITTVGSLAAATIADNAVSLSELLTSLTAGLTSLGIVWGVPNVGGMPSPKTPLVDSSEA